MSPNHLAWPAQWFITYGTGWCACAPLAILFLRNFIPAKNCMRWPMYLSEIICEGIKNIPLQKRHTQRKLAKSMGVSKAMVHCWIVDSTIPMHSNSLKPVLTEENKVAQLFMVLDSRNSQDRMKFLDMMDQIHVDEKWFFLSWQKERYITKVMFLCAIVRPHFNPCANLWWDGKLRIWSIGDWEPAKQGSKNRPKGTLVWMNKAVTKEVYQELLISKLLPAIVEKWPWMDHY